MTITPEQLAAWKQLSDRALRGGEWGWQADFRAGYSTAVSALIAEVERLAPYDPPYCADCGTEHWPHDEKGHEVVSGSPSACQVERLRRFAPLIDHLSAQYAERGNLDADMARIASGEAVPFTTLHAKGCNGRHDDTTRCQG